MRRPPPGPLMWAAPFEPASSPGVLAGTFGEAPTVTTFTEVGICGDILRLTCRPGPPFGWTAPSLTASTVRMAERWKSCGPCGPLPPLSTRDLAALIQAEEAKAAGLTMTFEDGKEDSLSAEVMNAFVEQLKKQVEFCATIKGYIQLSAGSLIGIRDVFQALEGYMIWQPRPAAPRCLKRSASPIPPAVPSPIRAAGAGGRGRRHGSAPLHRSGCVGDFHHRDLSQADRGLRLLGLRSAGTMKSWTKKSGWSKRARSRIRFSITCCGS